MGARICAVEAISVESLVVRGGMPQVVRLAFQFPLLPPLLPPVLLAPQLLVRLLLVTMASNLQFRGNGAVRMTAFPPVLGAITLIVLLVFQPGNGRLHSLRGTKTVLLPTQPLPLRHLH